MLVVKREEYINVDAVLYSQLSDVLAAAHEVHIQCLQPFSTRVDPN